MKENNMHVFLFLCKALLALAIGAAQAHEINPIVIDINQPTSPNTQIRLSLEPILVDMDLSQVTDTDLADEVEQYQTLRALSDADLIKQFRQQENEILQKLGVSGSVSNVQIEVQPQGDLELPRISVITLDHQPPAPWVWQGAVTVGEIVLRDQSDQAYTAVLAPGQVSAQLDQPITTWQQFQVYVISGIEHIIPKGLDHILFVMGLFLFSHRWRPLLAQVTVFTAAHTVTLALASVGWVQISGSIVEPLIALSIVYVAVENLLPKRVLKRRLALVLAFGLLHGLGFASVLQDFGLGGEHFAVSLIGFNLGVEIGQLLVLLPMMILLGTWAANQSWYRRAIQIPISLAIGGVGLMWTLERVLG